MGGGDATGDGGHGDGHPLNGLGYVVTGMQRQDDDLEPTLDDGQPAPAPDVILPWTAAGGTHVAPSRRVRAWPDRTEGVTTQEVLMATGERIRDMVGGQREDNLTKTIESQTEPIPSVAFLALAIGSMAVSLIFMATGRRNIANFVGQWAPTILILGLYNKVVKQHGSE